MYLSIPRDLLSVVDENMSKKSPEGLNFEEELKRYLRADPFSPLEILTTSGDRYQIKDPGQVALGESTMFAALPGGVYMIRKNQIVAVRVQELMP
jgi:hypothetical protein